MQYMDSYAFNTGTVAVVGLGKIGLPLALQFALHGWRVLGCDINPAVVQTVNAGCSHVQGEPGLAEGLASVVAQGLLSASCDTAGAVRQARVVVVIVPVVVDARHEVDFSILDAATNAVGAGLQAGTLVIYETTVPVGTTSQRAARLLERRSGLRAGQDFLLAFSPERVSSGSLFRDLARYPKVVGGIDQHSTEAAAEFYRSVLTAPVMVMASSDEAEFVKLIETTYRDVNIALANEYARFADAHGLNALAAIAAANTQPYSHIHTPGVGVGGHCIPVYPYFLLEGDPSLGLPRSARRINDAMADYAVQRLEAELGPLLERSVLIMGISYRGDVRETAFSSASLLQEALLRCGARVFADDPLFSATELSSAGYIPLGETDREQIEAIILQAAHQSYRAFDFSCFPRCRALLDGRSAFERAQIEARGMRYLAIGDGRYEREADMKQETRIPAMQGEGGE